MKRFAIDWKRIEKSLEDDDWEGKEVKQSFGGGWQFLTQNVVQTALHVTQPELEWRGDVLCPKDLGWPRCTLERSADVPAPCITHSPLFPSFITILLFLDPQFKLWFENSPSNLFRAWHLACCRSRPKFAETSHFYPVLIKSINGPYLRLSTPGQRGGGRERQLKVRLHRRFNFTSQYEPRPGFNVQTAAAIRV